MTNTANEQAGVHVQVHNFIGKPLENSKDVTDYQVKTALNFPPNHEEFSKR